MPQASETPNAPSTQQIAAAAPVPNTAPQILAKEWATALRRSLVRRRLLPEIHLSKREFLRLAGRRLRELFTKRQTRGIL